MTSTALPANTLHELCFQPKRLDIKIKQDIYTPWKATIATGQKLKSTGNILSKLGIYFVPL